MSNSEAKWHLSGDNFRSDKQTVSLKHLFGKISWIVGFSLPYIGAALNDCLTLAKSGKIIARK